MLARVIETQERQEAMLQNQSRLLVRVVADLQRRCARPARQVTPSQCSVGSCNFHGAVCQSVAAQGSPPMSEVDDLSRRESGESAITPGARLRITLLLGRGHSSAPE
ncbi:unnamed protein product [Prorocentrum cordatum]|uniref:Uncharacterized protein n=1 Tax=Prorocentrum cordatum TaxID=2364126 RepID=A0ABN9VA90_9DINO|nr:unnamed protein product [Polarella glacialis]